jgi:16S rRNA (cytosine1402-N4)-methyltransferase
MVAKSAPKARIVGLDRDPFAVAQARERLGERGEVFQAPFSQLDAVLDQAGVGLVNVVFFDLGVSSLQLDQDDRGFAYSRDTPLDMRMDPSAGPTAADVLATYSQGELTRVFRELGEERFAGRIAAKVVTQRQVAPIARSGQLVERIGPVLPAPARRQGGNPAKRTFQALRVEVNNELGQIAAALPAAIARLKVGGRIIVMSYQSLEDRVVKTAFRAGATSSAPLGLPVEPDSAKPYLTLLTRGAERACPAEQHVNPRSAPVRLRAAERIRKTAP